LEYAARGVESLIFPWGNDFDSSLANYCDESCQRDGHDTANDDGHANTAPVGSYLNGASWIGALDMAGNVSEWTSSLYGNYPYSALAENNEDTTGMRVLRGGSWYGTSNILRSPFRDRIYSNYTDIGVGFRCARDLEN
jgi:formylglycine-generating enzyme required for sulfatase activity